MAGQPEAADDLIAELAKLMAQDSRPQPVAVEPQPAAPAARPVFALRIPGADNPAPQPAGPAPMQRQAAETATPPSTAPVDALDFDFNVKPTPSAQTPVVETAPVSVRPAAIAPSQARTPQPVAPVVTEEHDSIADLIAAELAAETQPAEAIEPPAPQPITAPAAPPAPTQSPAMQPTPAAQPAIESRDDAPQPAPPTAQQPAPSRPTPIRNPGLTAVNVSAGPSNTDRAARPALRSVNLQPTGRPEVDRFKVPPVFGLGSSAAQGAAPVAPAVQPDAAPQPQPSRDQRVEQPRREPEAFPAAAPIVSANPDSINEIENLIGRAVHVDREPRRREPEAPMPRPVVAAPAPAARIDRSSSVSSVDEAILAAAAATGAQVGWVDPSETDDDVAVVGPRARRAPRALGMTRAVAGPLVAVTLLLAAGFGLYAVLGMGRDAGPAPLLTADAGPVKETPVAEPEAETPQQSVVFNEIDGVVPGAEEQLVSRDQADVNEVTQVAVPEVSEEGLANRKVRTVTVRPDGTIVSGEDSVAGSAILPVARPVVPDVPGAETASPELLAAAGADAATSAVSTTEITPTPAEPAVPAETVATTPAVTPVQPGTTVPVVDATGTVVPGKTAPVPMSRPSGLQASAATPAAQLAAQPTSPVNAVVETPLASLPPQATPTATTEPLAQATEVATLPNNAPAYVQLSSQRTEAEARQAAASLITRYGPLFGGANMEVQRVDLGSRGVFYRVRVPASSKANADNICVNVKAAGGDCLTM